MKRAPDNVRYLGQFGEHILTRSFTARDPKATSGWIPDLAGCGKSRLVVVLLPIIGCGMSVTH
jgi:hypothetical protein